MTLALAVGGKTWEIGTPAFFNAFFSTVCVVLEHENWGSKFPTLMNGLYGGQVAANAVPALAAEVQLIREGLTSHAPDEVVWDLEDRAKAPPWGDDISEDIVSLANYFVTSDGQDLLGVLEAACKHGVVAGLGLSVE